MTGLSGELEHVVAQLTAVCPVMARAVARCPQIAPLRRRPNSYAGLARTISFQQISTMAGLAIWSRLETRLESITPENIHHASVEDIRACGFSRQKAGYLKNIAHACIEGRLDFDRLATASDDAARAELVRLGGVGAWTADIYLMFSLGRMDVFAVSDLALLESYRRLAGLDARPTPAQMTTISETWTPWRSVAAHLLWSAYRSDPSQRRAW